MEHEHEIDWNRPIEGGDHDDVAIFNATCSWVFCTGCNSKGLIVDDHGTFWKDANGELIT